MSVSRSLSFLWTPWSLGLSILLILITAGLCFVAWRRSGYSRSMGLLELLRLALVAIAAVLLNQPEWIEEYRPEEKPSVAVLWDASPSMETRDVVARGKSLLEPAVPARGRCAAGRVGVVAEVAGADERRGPAVLAAPARTGDRPARAAGQGTGEDPEPARDRAGLGRRLERGSAAGPGRGPAADQGRARLRRPRGQPDPPARHRAAVSLDAPTFGVAGKSVRIPFTIESTLPREYVTDRHPSHVRRRRAVQGGAHRPDEPHQRLDRLETHGRPATSRSRSRFPSTATRA